MRLRDYLIPKARSESRPPRTFGYTLPYTGAVVTMIFFTIALLGRPSSTSIEERVEEVQNHQNLTPANPDYQLEAPPSDYD